MCIKKSCIVIILLALSALSVTAQTQMTADEFESKVSGSQQVQLIDVRTAAEYQDGHLKSSKNVDYKSPDFKEQIKGLDKTKPVYVYCLSGGRSALASKALVENGFGPVYELKGGYLKWSSSGKKVEGGEGKTAKGMSMADLSLNIPNNILFNQTFTYRSLLSILSVNADQTQKSGIISDLL